MKKRGRPKKITDVSSKKRDADEKEGGNSDQDRKYFRGPDGRYVCEQPGCNFETLSSLGFKIISYVFIFFTIILSNNQYEIYIIYY